jgi:hypothetical protein
MRAIQNINFGELLTKQATRERMYYIKKMYILKSLLNTDTIRIYMPVTSGNTFCVSATKKSVTCKLGHVYFDTFYQLFISAVVLRSQPVLQGGKQVVIAQSEINDVRSVVKQLPVEMLKQFSSARSVCGHALLWSSTTPDASIPSLSF